MGRIYTEKGGLIETGHIKNKVYGDKCMLRVDQSTSTQDDEAVVTLTNQEVKDVIALLNDYLVYTEGKPYVVLAEPLLHPSVKIIVENQEVERIPSLINQYLDIENIISPGESFIDGEDYLRSIFKQEE
jgi:hypothetical protein